MNPITALKQRLARRFANSTLVQKLVLEKLAEDPKALARLGKQPAVFEQILEGTAQSEAALTRIIDSPAVLNRIMRSPKVFERLLEAVAANPESLYRMLSQRGMRKALATQNSFLQKIGLEKAALEQVLSGVPSDSRADAIKMLIGSDAHFLRSIGDAPEQMAAALLYRTTGDNPNVKAMAASERIILDGMIDALDAQLPKLLLEMVQSNPDLFKDGPLRDHAIRSLVSDAAGMTKLCLLYAVNPKNGASLGDRTQKLLATLLREPVFVQALIQSNALRLTLLHIIEDSAAAAGETVPDMLKTPRSNSPETV